MTEMLKTSETTEKLLKFIDASPSCFHAVKNICVMLEDAGCIRLLENETCFSVRDLALSGADLLALGFRGSDIGETQRQLLEAVFSGRCVNTREALLEEIPHLPSSFKTLT